MTASGSSCGNDLISAQTSALQRGACRHGAVHGQELGQAEVAEHVKGIAKGNPPKSLHVESGFVFFNPDF